MAALGCNRTGSAASTPASWLFEFCSAIHLVGLRLRFRRFSVDVRTPSEAQYNYNYDVVTNVQNMVIVIGLGVLWLKAKAPGAGVCEPVRGAAMYMLSSLIITWRSACISIRLAALTIFPLISSFLWFAWRAWSPI